MTTTDEKLRTITLAAAKMVENVATGPWNQETWSEYVRAANPAIILSLLDRLSGESALRARVKELEDALADAERKLAEYPLWQNAANTAQAKAERDRADIAEGNLKRAESALALALKSQRTPGTVEVCQHYQSASCGENDDHPNMGVCGRKNCPRKSPQQKGSQGT
jgi:hypothetical protein